MSQLYFELACNPAHFERLLHYGLVTPITIERARLALNHSRLTADQKVDLLYQTGFEVAGSVLRLFWRPKAWLQDEVNKFVAQHFHGFFLIGLQMRFEYMNPGGVFAFLRCAERVEREALAVNATRPVKWFVASDSQLKMEFVQAMYAVGKVVYAPGVIEHIQMGALGYNKTMMDSELLSRVDELIITGGSTFGWMSAVRRGRFPLFVNGRPMKANRTNEIGECERLRLSRPSEGGVGEGDIYGLI
jgi:hypothetical protein